MLDKEITSFDTLIPRKVSTSTLLEVTLYCRSLCGHATPDIIIKLQCFAYQLGLQSISCGKSSQLHFYGAPSAPDNVRLFDDRLCSWNKSENMPDVVRLTYTVIVESAAIHKEYFTSEENVLIDMPECTRCDTLKIVLIAENDVGRSESAILYFSSNPLCKAQLTAASVIYAWYCFIYNVLTVLQSVTASLSLMAQSLILSHTTQTSVGNLSVITAYVTESGTLGSALAVTTHMNSTHLSSLCPLSISLHSYIFSGFYLADAMVLAVSPT